MSSPELARLEQSTESTLSIRPEYKSNSLERMFEDEEEEGGSNSELR